MKTLQRMLADLAFLIRQIDTHLEIDQKGDNAERRALAVLADALEGAHNLAQRKTVGNQTPEGASKVAEETDEYPKPCLVCNGRGRKVIQRSITCLNTQSMPCTACNGTGIAMVVIVVRKEENR